MVRLVGNKIVVRNEKDIIELETKLARIKSQYLPFVVYTLKELINDIIINSIKSQMYAKGWSQTIIDGVHLDERAIKEDNKIQFWVFSDAKARNGFPVAEIMENGRRAYFVKPVWKKALRFFLKGTKVKAFSKGHQIPTMPAFKIVFNTVQKQQPRVQREFYRKQKAWYRTNLK